MQGSWAGHRAPKIQGWAGRRGKGGGGGMCFSLTACGEVGGGGEGWGVGEPQALRLGNALRFRLAKQPPTFRPIKPSIASESMRIRHASEGSLEV